MGTAGGIFWMSLSRPGTTYFGSHSASTAFLNVSVPHTKTVTQRMIHGSQACMMLMSPCGAFRISASLGTSWPGAVLARAGSERRPAPPV